MSWSSRSSKISGPWEVKIFSSVVVSVRVTTNPCFLCSDSGGFSMGTGEPPWYGVAVEDVVDTLTGVGEGSSDVFDIGADEVVGDDLASVG